MRIWQLLIVLAMVALVGACAGTKAAYKAADGLEEQAKVVSEHYFALVREGNDLKDRGVLSGSQLDAAQRVVETSRPIILELSTAAEAWTALANAETEADLERALSNAAIAVSRLVDIIKAVRTTTHLEESHGPFDHRIDRAA
jgi:hypothetical protein